MRIGGIECRAINYPDVLFCREAAHWLFLHYRRQLLQRGTMALNLRAAALELFEIHNGNFVVRKILRFSIGSLFEYDDIESLVG